MVTVLMRYYYDNGGYAPFTVGFKASSFEEALPMIEGFKCGLQVSTSGPIMIEQVDIRPIPMGNCFKLPAQLPELREFILTHKRS